MFQNLAPLFSIDLIPYRNVFFSRNRSPQEVNLVLNDEFVSMRQNNHENKLVLFCSGIHIQMRVTELTNVFNFRNSKLAKIGFECSVTLLTLSCPGFFDHSQSWGSLAPPLVILLSDLQST